MLQFDKTRIVLKLLKGSLSVEPHLSKLVNPISNAMLFLNFKFWSLWTPFISPTTQLTFHCVWQRHKAYYSMFKLYFWDPWLVGLKLFLCNIIILHFFQFFCLVYLGAYCVNVVCFILSILNLFVSKGRFVLYVYCIMMRKRCPQRTKMKHKEKRKIKCTDYPSI